MDIILNEISKDRNFSALLHSLEQGELPSLVNGVCDSALPSFTACVCKRLKKTALYIVSEEKYAYKLQSALKPYLNNALVYPSRTVLYDAVDCYSKEFEQERIAVLSALLEGNCDAVIAVADAVMQYTVSPEKLTENTLVIKQGSVFDIKHLCERLSGMGYARAELVEGVGQFSVRGGILDIYSPNALPVRIDFFGDEVDVIGVFDIMSQRRTENVSEAKIVPITENIYSAADAFEVAEYIDSILNSKRKLDSKVHETLFKEKKAALDEQRIICPDKYHAIICKKPYTIIDYLSESPIIVIEGKKVKERATAYYWGISKQLERLTDDALSDFDTAKCCMSVNEFEPLVSKRKIQFDAFLSNGSGDFRSYANISTRPGINTDINLAVMLDSIAELAKDERSIIYMAANSHSADNTLQVLNENGINTYMLSDGLRDGSVAVCVADGTFEGFEVVGANFVLVAETASVSRKKPRKNLLPVKGEKISSYADLSIGDYVVHINHGIGRFEGIKNLVTEGISRDYIKISYASGDSLYVPCNQLDSVSKYIGGTENIKLNRLGGTEWHKAKAKAKSAAKDIAKQLLRLYKARNQKIAAACVKDDELQQEFEAMFEYPETDGQLVATAEIKADMEKSVPMERLLCGDVGFGKTEVALRAVFKAVDSGYQAAILVPTTLLAWQHYQTIKTRFRGFHVKVGMLSRFNDKKTNDQIVSDVKNGKINIVVGTHRLLQKDIGFKSLGLLIVDEEQRFGVTHKEKIKTLATNVHTLTLTATPIPRTLNMALSGIRDMSVLEDAPTDRLPVQSYVLEYDDSIINDGIARELRRGGQVFYLYNNVEALYSRAAALAKRFPEANIAVGHGQMDKEQLSEIWESMVKGETDILVCTTIIETGVDVPNANTLIIEDADRMGLSQLHQIRGRVGRSTRRAYAYFTYKPAKMLNEIATKRLQAIQEYTEFGSGFKIAMRDLELRGAGSLLGEEQHGHIESIGYDLYIKLLQEAVDEEKGIEAKPQIDCSVEISVNAYIPERYIQSSSIRIDLYRKISSIRSVEDKDEIYDELIDRFGELPKETENLLDVALIRSLASELGFTALEQKGNIIALYSSKLDMPVCTALSKNADFRGRVMVSFGSRPHVALKLKIGQRATGALLELLKTYSEFIKKI